MKLRAILACILLAGALVSGARAQEYGAIGLYTDVYRATNTAVYAGAPTEFTMYVYVLPGSAGMAAAEFAVSYPPNAVPGAVTTNPLVAAQLGDLQSGMSVSFSGCQAEWTWTHSQQVFLVDTAHAWIEIVPHGVAGAIQLATCTEGFPIEPMTICSAVGLNEVPPPDTTAPALVDASAVSNVCVDLLFSEIVFEPTAEDVSHYEIFELAYPEAPLTISDATLSGAGTTVHLCAVQSFGPGQTYVVRVHDVTDRHGNAIAAGSEISFTTVDDSPPWIIGAAAPNDSVIFAVFNEPLAAGPAENPDNYRLYYGDGSPCASLPYAATLVAPDTVRLDFHDPKPPTLVQLTLRVWNVTDLAGNVIGLVGNGVNLILPDSSPPRFVWAQALDARTIQTQFNRSVTVETASDPAHYDVYERDDTLSTLPVLSTEYVNAQLYRIRLGADLAYEVPYVLRGRNIEDIYGAVMAVPDTIEFVRHDVDPPVVLSARAVTTTLVEIVFDEPVDSVTAVYVPHYIIYCPSCVYGSVAIAEATISPSLDTVRLALETPLYYNTEYELRVHSVLDLLGNEILITDLVIGIEDVFPPVPREALIVGPRMIILAFDEQVTAATAEAEANYSLVEAADSTRSVPIALAELSVGMKAVYLTFGEDLAHGTAYRLTVRNVSDVRGNAIPPAGTTIAFTYLDTVPPSLAGAGMAGPTSVRVAFSERLDPATAETAGNYALFETLRPDSTPGISSAALLPDSASVLLSLARSLRMLGYTVRVNDVADRHGNVIAANSTVAFAVTDTLPPVFAGVTATGARELVLAFDEKLLKTPAETESNYAVFRTADSSAVTGVSLATLLSDEASVRLSLAADLTHGAGYSVNVAGIADKVGNAIAPPGATLEFVYIDAIAPRLLSAAATALTTVRAVFSERLDPATAGNPANYYLYERYVPSRTIAVTACALEADSSSVLLTLASSVRQTSYALRVNDVTDRAGNPVAANSTVYFSPPDIFPPRLLSAWADTRWDAYAQFDEKMHNATTDVPGNYRVISLAAPYDTIPVASATLGEGGTIVALSLGGALALGQGYRLVVSNLQDVSYNTIAPGSQREFTAPAVAPAPGIGLYADAVRSTSTVRSSDYLVVFTLYVWCRPGAEGMKSAQFAIAYPSGVLTIATLYDYERLSALTGAPATGVAMAFTDCRGGWTWLCKQSLLYYTSYGSQAISLSPTVPAGGPAMASCATGYPVETPAVLSSLLCSPVYVATLLESSSIAWKEDAVEVAWRVSSIDPETRFTVSRSVEASGVWISLGAPVAVDGMSFLYRDSEVRPGATYRYRVTFNGETGTQTLFESDPVAVPTRALALDQNRPNPFNPSTTIEYFLPEAGRIALEIFDVAGRRIACLESGLREAGRHAAAWDGRDGSGRPVAAGIYVCRLTAGKTSLTRKMVLLR